MSAFPCPFCDLGFDSRAMLQMHVRRCHVTDDKPGEKECCKGAKVTPFRACPQAIKERSCWPSPERLEYVECGGCGPHWRYAK